MTIGEHIKTGGGIQKEPGISLETLRPEQKIRQKISSFFSSYGTALLSEGLVTEIEIYRRHDIHAFYRLARNPDEVIHVQGYPGFSNDGEVSVNVRTMDYKKMQEMRTRAENKGFDIKGNEHDAVIVAGGQQIMGYSHSTLSDLLALLNPNASIPYERLLELGLE